MQHKLRDIVNWWPIFSTQDACLKKMKRHRWPNRLEYQRCERGQVHILTRHYLHQCVQFRDQASLNACSVFERNKLPLFK